MKYQIIHKMDTKTPWYKSIPYIKKSKELFSSLNCKGINLWPIMASDIYTYYYFSNYNKKEEPNKKQKLLLSLNYLFFPNIPRISNTKNKILATTIIS